MKVLIVDDEIRLCRLINKLIKWQELGLEFAGFCHDGREAIETVYQESPDIVITDIRMPDVNGLELIEKIKQQHDNTYVIIISGHNDFDYAQLGIKFGVEDYILKPIRQEELNNALEKIVNRDREIKKEEQNKFRLEQQVDLNSKRIKSSFLEKLINNPGTIDIMLETARFNQVYGTRFEMGTKRLAAIQYLLPANSNPHELVDLIADKIRAAVTRLADRYHEIITYYDDTAFYLLAEERTERRPDIEKDLRDIRSTLKGYQSILEEVHTYFYLLPPIHHIGEFKKNSIQLKTLLKQRFFYPPGSIIDEYPTGEEEMQDYVTPGFFEDFGNYISTFNIGKLKEQESKLLVMLKNKKVHKGAVIEAIYNELIEAEAHEYKTSIKKEFGDIIDSQRRRFLKSDDYPRLFHDFYESVIGFMEEILANQHRESAKAVYLAKEYIQAEYSRPLTLEIVGREVGLNPVYLSSLFKKQTGTSFVDYIAEVRINKAKKALMNPAASVNDVAAATGFCDGKYFAKTFKKITGLSPSEYRKLYY